MSAAAPHPRAHRIASLYRRLAQSDAERAQLQLELAALIEEGAMEEPAAKKAKAPRRLVVIRPPPVEVTPTREPSEIDRARAREDLARLGYRTGSKRA